jgi:ParB family chromosome partitioning protein
MADRPTPKRGLGRGLSALMADVSPDESLTGEATLARRADTTLPVEKLEPNPLQPRRYFKREDMLELVASVREKGVLQPLIVRKHPTKTDTYEIVAGERRWRAAQQAQLHEVPVVVREYTDEEVLEIAIIENVQRSDLNAVDEARAYQQLMERFGHTQEKLAEALSKSRSYIANLIRLLQLPEDVMDMLRDGELTVGHARALITSPDPSALARQVVGKGLSVRETEKLAKGPIPKRKKKVALKSEKDADTKALEGDLSATTGMKVSIDHKANSQSGQVSIKYKTMEELDEICRLLSATSGGFN